MTDNFQEMFVRASSVDEGLYRKVLMRVSELDSPVVQPTVQAKRRKLEQEMSTPARETGHMHKLDPRSLESSFANATNPEQSPLDHIEAELVENVQLKKVLLSSAKEELVKATAQK